jgi:NADPH:quinone reductase-like Zn-dependent oxidoreductase
LNHFENKTVTPIIDQVFELAEIQQAHARMESNQNIGKIVLKVFDDSEEKNEKQNTEL